MPTPPYYRRCRPCQLPTHLILPTVESRKNTECSLLTVHCEQCLKFRLSTVYTKNTADNVESADCRHCQQCQLPTLPITYNTDSTNTAFQIPYSTGCRHCQQCPHCRLLTLQTVLTLATVRKGSAESLANLSLNVCNTWT